MGGWVGWLEKWGLKLISTQVVDEVEVGVELGNKEQEKIVKKLTEEIEDFLIMMRRKKTWITSMVGKQTDKEGL